MHQTGLVLSVLVLAFFPPLLQGAAPPCRRDPARLRALVRQLDDDDYKARERAEQHLSELAEADVPALRKALAAATSAEVRRRLGRVIRRLAVSERRIQRRKEVLRLLTSMWSGGNKRLEASLRQIVELSPEDFRLLREAVGDIANPRQRKQTQVIVDYLDQLRQRLKK
jgi:hypothetical protein